MIHHLPSAITKRFEVGKNAKLQTFSVVEFGLQSITVVRLIFTKLKWNNFFYFLPRVTTPGEKGDRATGCQNVSVTQKLYNNRQMLYLFPSKHPKNNTFPRCHRSWMRRRKSQLSKSIYVKSFKNMKRTYLFL